MAKKKKKQSKLMVLVVLCLFAVAAISFTLPQYSFGAKIKAFSDLAKITGFDIAFPKDGMQFQYFLIFLLPVLGAVLSLLKFAGIINLDKKIFNFVNIILSAVSIVLLVVLFNKYIKPIETIVTQYKLLLGFFAGIVANALVVCASVFSLAKE